MAALANIPPIVVPGRTYKFWLIYEASFLHL